MKVLRMVTATVLVLALAACSGDTPPGPGGGGGGNGGGDSIDSIPDPCTLVTKEEASTAVGAAMPEGRSDGVSEPGMPTGRSCTYRPDSGRGSLQVTIWPGDGALFEKRKEQDKGFGDVKDVAGVGDQAYRIGWTGLTVLKGTYIINAGIELVKYDPDTAQENLKTVVAASIGRL